MDENLRGLKVSILIWFCSFTALILFELTSLTGRVPWTAWALLGISWLIVATEVFRKWRLDKARAKWEQEVNSSMGSDQAPFFDALDKWVDNIPESEESEKTLPILYTQAELDLAVMREKERWVGIMVDKWHEGEGGAKSLPEYLGMGKEEYAQWLSRGVPG